MDTLQIIGVIGILVCILIIVVGEYDIRYKGKCILHDWEYKFEFGEYWSYTGTFLKHNRRFVCRKCKKEEKE